MTNIFFKFKNPIFGLFPQFLEQNIFFPENLAVMHNFIYVSRTMPKLRKKLMIQFQENAWTDGRTNRPYFIGPFWLLLGVQKYKYLNKF